MKQDPKKTLLLGIGAQKAGTTWLFSYLRRSDQICASPIKELHFFDAWLRPDIGASFNLLYLRQLKALMASQEDPFGDRMFVHLLDRVRMSRYKQAYVDYFNRINQHDRPILLEVTPSYAVLNAEQFANVRTFVEAQGWQLRVVFIMRDPVSRYFSAVRMAEKQSQGERTVENFFLDGLSHPGHIARSRYDWTLQALDTAFDAGQVHIEFYESLVEDPIGFAERICSFADIEFMPPDSETRINASKAPRVEREEFVEAAMKAFDPVYSYVTERFGNQKPAAWRA